MGRPISLQDIQELKARADDIYGLSLSHHTLVASQGTDLNVSLGYTATASDNPGINPYDLVTMMMNEIIISMRFIEDDYNSPEVSSEVYFCYKDSSDNDQAISMNRIPNPNVTYYATIKNSQLKLQEVV